jgi:anaerobic selenocysteine-containing dehydrogenase
MDRRKFLYRVMAAMAGTTAAMALTKSRPGPGTKAAEENRSVTYDVRGFTCVTCALGLEVILLQQKGVRRASASYPRAKVGIDFDHNLTSEEALREIIARCGFSVT